MKPRLLAAMVFAVCACVAGCAAPGVSPVTASTAAANTIPARNAMDTIHIGKSTRAEVIAALGKATIVSFDSGFEVWVYQILGGRITGETSVRSSWLERVLYAGPKKGARGNAEFVVLFAPSGLVAKTRIRPAPPPGEAKGS